MRVHGILVTALALATLGAAGTVRAEDPLKLTSANFLAIDEFEKSAQGRPNEEHRIAALKAYVRGDYARAAKSFETAAYYADKYSQHALSLMYWHGVGVDANRVQAYVWADLAAERGARKLLLVRERMWQDLTEAQQRQAQAGGETAYARYGDEVAQPRAESMMRRFATSMTGSRIGFDSKPLAVSGKPTAGSFGPETGSNSGSYVNSAHATLDALYGGSRRNLAAYWKEQERIVTGTGRAGELQQVSPPRR